MAGALLRLKPEIFKIATTSKLGIK